jgi:predicted HicB family RNase H-like nuclease
MKYKGYRAKLDWDTHLNMYFGRLLNIEEEVVFEAHSMTEAKKAFRAAVEEYLEYCKKNGKIPERGEDTFFEKLEPDEEQVPDAIKAQQPK